MNIKGVGILYVEESCQVFSEGFLLLSTTIGYTNYTLTQKQVVIPELPALLTEEETQVLVGNQDQTDGTLGALDALMAKRLAVGQQNEVNLRDLLTDLQLNQRERKTYRWVDALIALTLSILLAYLTSKCWLQPHLEFASWFARRRTRVPAKVPVPKPRDARTLRYLCKMKKAQWK
jgi:hypothetical protein